MKLPAILLVTVLNLLFGCGRSSTTNEVVGTYNTDFKDEHTVTSDIITITAFSKEANLYQADRHTGFNRIRDGKSLPKECQQKQWKATYDQDTIFLLKISSLCKSGMYLIKDWCCSATRLPEIQ